MERECHEDSFALLSSCEGSLFFMKMNRHSQIFAKQVQVDLLSLSDADLFQAIQQWVNGEPSELSHHVPEETRSVLGYTSRINEPHALSSISLLGGALEAEMQWLAPDPHQLRILLTDMDVKIFTQHVLPLAFQSLHATYPEWYEGVTFNAHLANYLRRIGMERRAMTR